MAAVAERAADNLIPVCDSFIADCETPVSAFLKLRALAPGEPAFLLESADQGQRVGRWSFIGFRPRSVLRWSLADGGDPYALAAERVARYRQAPMPDGVDAPPFTGGAVGFFGYDLVRTVEPLGEPGPDPLGLPDMALMLSDALVAFDHLKHTITILANADLRGRAGCRARASASQTLVAEIRAALAGPVPAVPCGRASRGSGRRTSVLAGTRDARVPVEHDRRAVRSDGRADRRVHLRRRRLSGRALPALVGALAGAAVLDLSRPARGEPQPLHVLPGLRRLPGRRRQSRAAADGQLRRAGPTAARA